MEGPCVFFATQLLVIKKNTTLHDTMRQNILEAFMENYQG